MPAPVIDCLLIGCGDVAQRIGRQLVARGLRVTGIARSAENLAAAERLGIRALPLDLDRLDAALPTASRVFYCAAPPGSGDGDPRLAGTLAHLPPPALGFLYVSTTGVYGDCQGRWITEAEPLKPQTARGQRRLAAEMRVREYGAATGCKVLLLRVPGIYGPGRLPEARLKAGTPILRSEDAPYSNRIHADDLAAAAILVLERGGAGEAYHVSDGEPSTMTDYFLQCAAVMGLPPPPQITLDQAREQLPANLLSYFEESKRLDTSKLRALGFVPRFPSLREGLPGCF